MTKFEKLPQKKYGVKEAFDIIAQEADNTFSPSTYVAQFNLNIDPIIKEHRLKGVLDLPHGNGKKLEVAALTSHQDLAISALQVGAKYAGDFSKDLKDQKIVPDVDFKVLIVTTEMGDLCVRRKQLDKHFLSKMLQKSKLTPTVKDFTLVEPANFVETVQKFANGTYARFKAAAQHGAITIPLGRVGVQTPEQVAENFEYTLKYLYSIKPESFGTGKRRKKKNIGKYVLGIQVHAKGADSLALDLTQVLGSVDNVELYE